VSPLSPVPSQEAAPALPSSSVVDLTVGAVSDTELRRRAANGDQAALVELARRGSMLVEAA
jgi:hypothetical protein